MHPQRHGRRGRRAWTWTSRPGRSSRPWRATPGRAAASSSRASRTGIMVVEDYGHHPTEIKATLDGAKRGWERRLVAVFQPHRYTRTVHLHGRLRPGLQPGRRPGPDRDLPGRRDARSPASPARPSTTRSSASATRTSISSPTWRASRPRWKSSLRPGDIVIVLGAGNINRIIPELLGAAGGKTAMTPDAAGRSPTAAALPARRAAGGRVRRSRRRTFALRIRHMPSSFWSARPSSSSPPTSSTPSSSPGPSWTSASVRIACADAGRRPTLAATAIGPRAGATSSFCDLDRVRAEVRGRALGQGRPRPQGLPLGPGDRGRPAHGRPPCSRRTTVVLVDEEGVVIEPVEPGRPSRPAASSPTRPVSPPTARPSGGGPCACLERPAGRRTGRSSTRSTSATADDVVLRFRGSADPGPAGRRPVRPPGGRIPRLAGDAGSAQFGPLDYVLLGLTDRVVLQAPAEPRRRHGRGPAAKETD